MEVSGQVASFVDFFGDVLGDVFFCFWEGSDFRIPETNSLFWGLAPGNRPKPSLGVIFFGDCMHPMTLFGDCIIREVSIGKFLRIVIHPQNETLPMQLPWFWIEKNLFEPPSSRHWVLQSIFHVHRVEGCRPIKSKPSLGN